MPLLPHARKRAICVLIRDSRRRWLKSRSWTEAQYWASETDRFLDMWLAEFGTPDRKDAPR